MSCTPIFRGCPDLEFSLWTPIHFMNPYHYCHKLLVKGMCSVTCFSSVRKVCVICVLGFTSPCPFFFFWTLYTSDRLVSSEVPSSPSVTPCVSSPRKELKMGLDLPSFTFFTKPTRLITDQKCLPSFYYTTGFLKWIFGLKVDHSLSSTYFTVVQLLLRFPQRTKSFFFTIRYKLIVIEVNADRSLSSDKTLYRHCSCDL